MPHWCSSRRGETDERATQPPLESLRVKGSTALPASVLTSSSRFSEPALRAAARRSSGLIGVLTRKSPFRTVAKPTVRNVPRLRVADSSRNTVAVPVTADDEKAPGGGETLPSISCGAAEAGVAAAASRPSVMARGTTRRVINGRVSLER